MMLSERSEALILLDTAQRETARAGAVALVAGEAGIGKSALVHAFAEGCRSRATVLWGVCDPLVTPRASGPLHDIAGQPAGRCATGWPPGPPRPRCSPPSSTSSRARGEAPAGW